MSSSDCYDCPDPSNVVWVHAWTDFVLLNYSKEERDALRVDALLLDVEDEVPWPEEPS